MASSVRQLNITIIKWQKKTMSSRNYKVASEHCHRFALKALLRAILGVHYLGTKRHILSSGLQQLFGVIFVLNEGISFKAPDCGSR
jgi:hypothetical protein